MNLPDFNHMSFATTSLISKKGKIMFQFMNMVDNIHVLKKTITKTFKLVIQRGQRDPSLKKNLRKFKKFIKNQQRRDL